MELIKLQHNLCTYLISLRILQQIVLETFFIFIKLDGWKAGKLNGRLFQISFTFTFPFSDILTADVFWVSSTPCSKHFFIVFFSEKRLPTLSIICGLDDEFCDAFCTCCSHDDRRWYRRGGRRWEGNPAFDYHPLNWLNSHPPMIIALNKTAYPLWSFYVSVKQ